MRQQRTPDGSHRDDTASLLKDVATMLLSPNAAAVFRNLSLSAEIGYPKRSSGTQVEPSHESDEDGLPVRPDSATERAALNVDAHAIHAQRLTAAYYELGSLAAELARGLAGFDPLRVIKVCPRCETPLKQGQVRCQEMSGDGVRCGSSENAWPDCLGGCGKSLPPGERRGGRCSTCYRFRKRNNRDRASVSRLALDDGLLTEDGAYVDSEAG